MKIKFKIEDIADPLSKLSKVIPKTSPDIFSTKVMISAANGKADLIGVNRKLQKSVEVPFTGDDGEFAITFDKLNNLVKKLPNDKTLTIKVDFTDKKASLTCGRLRVTSPIIDSDSMPIISDKSLTVIDINYEELSEAIRTVSFASAKDDALHAINGVCVSPDNNGLIVAATNKVIIAAKEIEAGKNNFGEFIIPVGMCSIAQEDILDATKVSIGSTHLSIGGNGFKTLLPLVDAKYLNFRRVIESNGKNPKYKLTFNKEQMKECLNRISIIANDPQRSRCTITAPVGESDAIVRGWYVAGDSSEIVDSIPMINDSDEDMSLAYNPSFILSAISKLESDTIDCVIYDNDIRPLTISESGFTCVISKIMV